jgi:hypothetical protein
VSLPAGFYRLRRGIVAVSLLVVAGPVQPYRFGDLVADVAGVGQVLDAPG